MFSTKFIPAGTVLDIAHLVFLKSRDYDLVKPTALDDYTFEWLNPVEGEDVDIMAVAMSPCEFCNHSYTPNAGYKMDYENKTIVFQTVKDIDEGDEILVNYNGVLDDRTPVWFDVVDSCPAEPAPVQQVDMYAEQVLVETIQELSDASVGAVTIAAAEGSFYTAGEQADAVKLND